MIIIYRFVKNWKMKNIATTNVSCIDEEYSKQIYNLKLSIECNLQHTYIHFTNGYVTFAMGFWETVKKKEKFRSYQFHPSSLSTFPSRQKHGERRNLRTAMDQRREARHFLKLRINSELRNFRTWELTNFEFREILGVNELAAVFKFRACQWKWGESNETRETK